MSALPTQNLKLDGAIDWSRWVDAREASQLLGVNRDSLTRQCRDELERIGHAMFHRSPDGGNARWWINRSNSKLLWSGKAGENHRIPEDFWQREEKQQKDAWARVACVKVLREAKISRLGDMKDWIDSLAIELGVNHPNIRVSVKSLYRWSKNYVNPADIMKLVDTRGGNTRGEPDPAAWRAFTELFMSERQIKLTVAWKRVRDEAAIKGWRWTSETACRRMVDSKLTKQDIAKARTPALFRSHYRAFLEQDPEGFEAGECWIGDHCQLDMICRVGFGAHEKYVRPWLTAWMDWRTRRIMGFAIVEDPNSTAILAALRQGLLADDLITMPRHVWIDNGKDFDCYLFHGQTKRQRQLKRGFRADVDEAPTHGLLANFGIEAHFSIPHNPNGKSRLEHWFGYGLHEVFDKLWPTYCGNEPSSRPEYLNETIKAGTYIPQFDEVASQLRDHIAGFNLSSEHSKADMLGLSPNDALAAMVKTRHIARDPQAMSMLLMKHHQPVRVNKNGITIRIAGKPLHYGAFEPALVPYKGASASERPQVHVLYDPDDMSSIHVFDSKMRKICETRANEVYGNHVRGDEASEKRLRDAMRTKDRYNRLEKEVAANRHLTFASAFSIAARAAAQEKAPPPSINPDATMQPVQTPLDDESNRSVMRKAVGAEHDELPKSKHIFKRHEEDEDDEPLALIGTRQMDDLFDEDEDELVIGSRPLATFAQEEDDMDEPLSLPVSTDTDDSDRHLLDELP